MLTINDHLVPLSHSVNFETKITQKKMNSSVTEDALISLISRDPSNRSEMDIDSVAYWLRRRSHLLYKLSKEVLYDIIKNCGYKKVSKDEIIIRQGDVGESFYILINGKASVYTDADEDISIERQLLYINGASMTPRGQMVSSKVSGTGHGNFETVDRTQFGKYMTSFENGSSFGEIALMSKRNVRNATIVADNVCHLLVISSDLFSRSLKCQQETEFRERYNFIKEHPWFSKWNSRFKRLLEMCLQKVSFGFGQPIVCQGRPVEGIHFILGGQAIVTVEPQRHHLQYPKLMNDVKRGRQHRFEWKNGVIEKTIKGNTDVCVLGPGQIIGDVELICELPTNIASVSASSKTETFFLSYKNCDRIFVKKNQKTVEEMEKLVSQKLSARSEAHGDTIPLFKILCEKLKRRPVNKVYNEKNLLREAGARFDQSQIKEKDQKRLVTLFLNNQSALSSPYTVDSIFYRYRSFVKNKQIMRNTNRTLKRFDDILCPKGRVPRSVSQIKNNVFAQQKLLGRPVTASGTDMDPEMNRSVISRSRTLLRSKSDLGGVPESSHCSSAGITQTGQSMFNPLSHRTFDKIQNISTKLSYLQESKLEMRAKETRALLAKENFVRRLKQIQDSGEDTEDLVDVCEFGSVPVAWDEEVTDSQLCSLERKLKEFCSIISKDDHKPNSIQIQNFKRFNIQNSSDIPQPGGTVLVECRPCLQTLDNVQLTNHSHTHHYILNK